MVWAFPRGKPQLFTDSPRGLSNGVLVYAFGRRIPRVVQSAIAIQARLPGLRRWSPSVVCALNLRAAGTCGTPLRRGFGHVAQYDMAGCICAPMEQAKVEHHRSECQTQPQFFLTIEPFGNRSLGPVLPSAPFRVPACTDSFRMADWSVRQYELLPQFHRPSKWDLKRIREVAAEPLRPLQGRSTGPFTSLALATHTRQSRALESSRGRSRASLATGLGGRRLGSAAS